MKFESLVDSFVSVICILAAVANACGLYLLSKLKRPFANQTKIIISISVCEILISTLVTVTSLHRFIAKKTLPDPFKLIAWQVFAALFFAWYALFYLLIVDRFLSCSYPFWYRSGSSKKLIKVSLTFTWILTLPILLALLLGTDKCFQHISYLYLWMALDILFIAMFATLYARIFFLTRRSNKNARRYSGWPANKKFLRVTSSILTTFILLEAVPTVIYSTLLIVQENVYFNTVYKYLTMVWRLNLLADPLIYIFMQPQLYRYLLRVCICSKKTNDCNRAMRGTPLTSRNNKAAVLNTDK